MCENDTTEPQPNDEEYVCQMCGCLADTDKDECVDCGAEDFLTKAEDMLNQQINHDDDIKEDEELFNE